MEELNKILKTDSYNGCTCIYYPKINAFAETFGSISINISEWEKLQQNFRKYTSKTIKRTIYTYHDMELIIDNNKSCKNYEMCTQQYCQVCDNYKGLISIIHTKNINPEKFPIISNYDKTVDQEIKLYIYEGITISFVKEIDTTEKDNNISYYFHISFVIDKTNRNLSKKIESIICLFN